jgi:hypothetical protein
VPIHSHHRSGRRCVIPPRSWCLRDPQTALAHPVGGMANGRAASGSIRGVQIT